MGNHKLTREEIALELYCSAIHPQNTGEQYAIEWAIKEGIKSLFKITEAIFNEFHNDGSQIGNNTPTREEIALRLLCASLSHPYRTTPWPVKPNIDVLKKSIQAADAFIAERDKA